LIYLFEKFELDDLNFCLSREGQRVPLEPRALRVLLLFVQNPGKLLQKNFILETVWTTTFVEESTLTRAITILRKQLGDDPRAPTYIETVPTLGYRFIAKVEIASPPEQMEIQADARSRPDAQVVPDRQPLSQEAELDEAGSFAPSEAIEGGEHRASESLSPGRQRQSAQSRYWIFLLVLLLGAAGSVIWWKRHSRPVREEKRTIVISDFDNSTGDAVFDGTLREGMTVQLEQSPVLSLVSEPRIRSTLLLMNQPVDSRLTPVLAREVCQRTNSAAMLDGSIAALGSQYVITLHATDCATGDSLDTEQVQVDRKEDVLRALSDVAASLRSRLGESIASIKSLDTPLDEATTSSLDALKAFSESGRVGNQSGSAAAIPLAQRAVELDPKFALAWAMLGRMYGDIGQEQASAESTAKAYEFRDHASDREKFFIVVSYEIQVTGDLEKAEQTCETWSQIYPHDTGGYGFRAGAILRVFGSYERAVEVATHLDAIHPDFALGYHFAAFNDIALGHYADARRVVDDATARHFSNPFLALDQYRLAFLAEDEGAMKRVVAAEETLPESKDIFANQLASTLAYHGQLDSARKVSKDAVELMKQSGRREAAARLEAGSALREAFFGDQAQARRLAQSTVGLSNSRDAEFGAAFAFALSGDSTQANALIGDLEKRLPEDTSVHFHYSPAVRALIALNAHDPVKAIELLQANVAYELGSPQSSFDGFYGVLYPIYVRGLAYLMLHRGSDAVSEFRKILDHPGIVANDPIGALANLQLGRAYVQSGDVTRARAAYRDFKSLWKNSDPELPLWKQSRLEFSHIQAPDE
jgi:DNA-binding winged helix-turn-helix (wHTH) protein/tetratricopeptide (TPR) repeat protein